MALEATKVLWALCRAQEEQVPSCWSCSLSLLSPAATGCCWLWNKTKETQLQLNKQLMQRSKRKLTKHNLKENNSKHKADALFSLPCGTDTKKSLKSLKSTSNLTGARIPHPVFQSLVYVRGATFFTCFGFFGLVWVFLSHSTLLWQPGELCFLTQSFLGVRWIFCV